MAFHQTIQNVLLTGVRIGPRATSVTPQYPAALKPLVEAIAPSHSVFNLRAIDYGHRYRSAYWAIYLLSALAVLCAVLPLALGWDDGRNDRAHFSAIWVVSELFIIATVGLIYWRGHQQDWQGQWLAARTMAELAGYLPLIAPLIDFSDAGDTRNWYVRLIDPSEQPDASVEIDALCTAHAALAQRLLLNAWDDPQFIASYAAWAVEVLEGQRQYHLHLAARQHALLHRIHSINTGLFGLTGIGAFAHLLVHSNILTLVTTFCPALGASLHGAVAQSEAYRLEATSQHLAAELDRAIAPIRKSLHEPDPFATAKVLSTAIPAAVELILEEHKDWHMLVRPHHLPLA